MLAAKRVGATRRSITWMMYGMSVKSGDCLLDQARPIYPTDSTRGVSISLIFIRRSRLQRTDHSGTIEMKRHCFLPSWTKSAVQEMTVDLLEETSFEFEMDKRELDDSGRNKAACVILVSSISRYFYTMLNTVYRSVLNRQSYAYSTYET